PLLNEQIEAMTPTLEIFAMVQFNGRLGEFTMPVRLIGIDPVGRSRVGGFSEYLVQQKNSSTPSFALSEQAKRRHELQSRPLLVDGTFPHEPPKPGQPPAPEPPPSRVKVPEGIILGYALASFRKPGTEPGGKPQDVFLLEPGDDVIITTVRGQQQGKPLA